MDNVSKFNHREFNKGTEFDWQTELHVNGMNLHTMQYENTSWLNKGAKMVLNIYQDMADNSEYIAEEAKQNHADFILFRDNWCVGYVIDGLPEKEESMGIKRFNILEYLKNGCDDYLAHIIQLWEKERCAEAEESVFFLSDKKDFTYFIEKYGVKEANRLYNHYDYVMDGTNFTNPKPLTRDDMQQFIADEFDEDYVKKLIDNGDIAAFEDYFNIGGIFAYFGMVDKKKVVKAVAEQLCNMIENNTIHENGFEPFEGWIADGEVFDESELNVGEIQAAVELVKEMSEEIDSVIWKHLAIENIEN